MKHISKRLFIVIGAALIIVSAIIIGVLISHSNRLSLLDKNAYKTFSSELSETYDAGFFTSQQDLRDYITSWADSNSIDYTVDKNNNIIFTSDATATKKKVSPTVVCVSYNYETVSGNEDLLASAAMIASTDLRAGKYTVIFFNNENNTNIGYKNISNKYFTNKDKIIYLDYGKSSYISESSFAMNTSTIAIPTNKSEVKCDTAVKVHISGIASDEIGSGVAKKPNTIIAFSTLLTRLKTKSVICQLADFDIEDHGKMYPVTLDATILMNSYSVKSFTGYLDNQIKSWQKKYAEDNPDFEYTYEVTEDIDLLPTEAYTDGTLKTLTNVLYMIKNDSYEYEVQDNIPENREEGDVCGLNCIKGLRINSKGNICIDLLSQGYDQSYLDRINADNQAAADLFNCTYKIKSNEPAFLNKDSSVARVILSTYQKVNDITSAASTLSTDIDNYFTPCTYLAKIKSGVDVIHVKLNHDKAIALTNTILYYIVTKGNLLSI